jgi:capsid protein
MIAAATEGQTLSMTAYAGAGVPAEPVTIPRRLTSSGGYSAGESSDRRRSAPIKTGSEEIILGPSQRSQLTANSRDLARNFEVPGWAARRHLDYVCDFEFAAKHDDKGFEDDLEQFVEDWSLEENFEVSGRFSREQFIRLVEQSAIFDGDILIVRLDSAKIQAVEGDRLRNDGGANFVPTTGGGGYWQGVNVDNNGKALGFKVHRRNPSGGFEFEREVKAENARLYAYAPRFDSVRGVSPIAAALNTFRDIYDNKDLALAKAKITNIFGVKFQRSGDMGPLDVTTTNGANGRKEYSVDYTGPFQVDLDPGDDAAIMHTDAPGPNFQEFMIQMLQVALKALDIPFSFYNESFTNFFGSRAAWHHYERSCTPKRNRVKSLLTWLTLWRVGMAIDDGDFFLPSGMSLEDLRRSISWIPKGMPWWKPSEEINGDLAAIAGGLTSPQRVCKARGTGDYYELIDELAHAQKYATDKGVTLNYAGFIPGPPDVNDQQPTNNRGT